MRRSTAIILLLVLLLIGSNAWWAYHAVDAGVTQTYMGVSLDDNKQALAQTLTLLPVVARPGATRADVVAAARAVGPQSEPFEKDGFFWVGKIGLKFNEHGHLVEASRAWSPP